MGLVFLEQGRYGAAVSSIQDALKGLKSVGESKTRNVAEVQNDLAAALARSGRLDEAQTALDAAQAVARELRGNAPTAALMITQGEIDYYRGNLSAAGPEYQKAARAVGRKDDRTLEATAQLGVAEVALSQGRDREAEKLLSSLMEKKIPATKAVSIQMATAYADALIRRKDDARAKQLLLANLGDAEKAGMRPEAAAIYYVLGLAAKSRGNLDEAASYSRQAIKAVDAIRAERPL
jgi:tetratricopeptide (TPR) repeat protein